MKDLQIFTNPEFGKIRAIEIDGEPWFVGKDVAAALGYSNTKDALSSHVDPEDKSTLTRQNSGFSERSENATFNIPNRGLTIINESGIYSLIFSSKLPSAKRFKRWVTSEVLPAIRKTGMYIQPETVTVLPKAKPDVSLVGVARVLTVTRRMMLDAGCTPDEVIDIGREILNTCGFSLPEFKRKKPFIALELVDFLR